MKNFFRFVTAFSFTVLSVFGSACAQDQWINDFGGFFDVGNNWADGSAPGVGENASFVILPSYPVNFDEITGNISNDLVSVENGTVRFNNTSAISEFDLSYSAQNWIINNNGSTIFNGNGEANNLNLSVDAGLAIFDGRFEIFDGSVTAGLVDVGLTGNSTAIVDGSNTTLSVDDQAIWVGRGVNGGLFIQNGATVSDPFSPRIGATPGGIGTVVISGDDSQFNIGQNLTIGDIDDTLGSLSLFNGSSLSINSDLRIAYLEGVSGGTTGNFIRAFDTATIVVGGDVLIGDAGSAEIQLSDSTTLEVSGDIVVGHDGEMLGTGSGVPVFQSSTILNDGLITFDGVGSDIFGTVINDGSIRSEGNSINIFVGDFQNDGSMHTAEGAQTRILGNTSGDGFFLGNGTVQFNGSIRPGVGSGTNVVGLLEMVGDAVLNQSFEVEFSGSGWDQFWIDNDVSIGNSCQLCVSSLGGFVPEIGETYLILCTWGTRTGFFAGLPEGAKVTNIAGVDLNISYFGGDDGRDIVLVGVPGTSLKGDVNTDGNISLLDVNPFVSIVTSGTYQSEADVNCDGFVDLLDVNAFVELLAGG